MVERTLMRNAVLSDPKVLIVAILVLVVIGLAVWKDMSRYSLQPADKGTITVYGSKSCPWCVKQEAYLTDKGIPYTFVECDKQQCPEFVQGFPTLSVNGEIKHGYTEL